MYIRGTVWQNSCIVMFGGQNETDCFCSFNTIRYHCVHNIEMAFEILLHSHHPLAFVHAQHTYSIHLFNINIWIYCTRTDERPNNGKIKHFGDFEKTKKKNLLSLSIEAEHFIELDFHWFYTPRKPKIIEFILFLVHFILHFIHWISEIVDCVNLTMVTNVDEIILKNDKITTE